MEFSLFCCQYGYGDNRNEGMGGLRYRKQKFELFFCSVGEEDIW